MLVFRNPGLIPIEAITTMGINAKETNNPIGFFGTGLKIAIAVITRLGGIISIYVGNRRFEFSTITKSIRGKDFNFVTMDGQPLGFTSDLGKKWEPWMAMRELESNVRDEGGKSFMIRKQDLEPLLIDNYTTIVVECAAVEKAWLEKHKYFLESEPLASIRGIIEFHAGGGADFFFRGIRVGALPGELPYTINIQADFQSFLTEDRTLDTIHALRLIGQHTPELTNVEMIRRLFPPNSWSENSDRNFIHEIDFDWMGSRPSTVFVAEMEKLRQKDLLAVPRSVSDMLIRLSLLKPTERFKIITPNKIQKKMIERAIQYLVDLGYEEDTIKMYPVHVASLGENVYGLADNDEILLSPNVFEMGTKFVCSTLHEEYLHVHYNLRDMSRHLQQHLFDKLASTMENYFYEKAI